VQVIYQSIIIYECAHVLLHNFIFIPSIFSFLLRDIKDRDIFACGILISFCFKKLNKIYSDVHLVHHFFYYLSLHHSFKTRLDHRLGRGIGSLGQWLNHCVIGRTAWLNQNHSELKILKV